MNIALLNGVVLTPFEKREAVFISGNRIEAVGKNREIEKLIDKETEVIDLNKRMVVPGFIDSHTHFIDMGYDFLDLSTTKTIKEVLKKLREEEKKDKDFVVGVLWDESNWREKRYITKKDLKGFKKPIFLKRVCGHMATLNDLAFDVLDVEGKVDFEKGFLYEETAFEAFRSIVSEKEMEMALERATKIAHRHGVTSIHDSVYPKKIKVYQRQDLKVRVYMNVYVEHLDSVLKLGIRTGFGNKKLRFGGIKIFADGSLGAHTAYLSKNYNDKKTRGMLLYSREELREYFEKIHENQLQIVCHAIGDSAIEIVLDCLQGLENRHRVEHLEILTPKIIEKLKKSMVICSMQPNFLKWSNEKGLYHERLGDRLRQNNLFRVLKDAGIKIAFGSDCMPFSPIFGIHHASNAPLKEQRLTPKEALEMYTINGAYASHEENIKGSIEKGKLADLTVLSCDITKNRMAIMDTKVLMTIFDGEIVYRNF